MAAVPLLEEMSSASAGALIGSIAGYAQDAPPPAIEEAMETVRPPRKLAVYQAAAGFDLVEELDFLAARAIEPNVFFNPRFLAPAMPRLEDREVKLAVIRDGDEFRSRLRLLAPFTIEKPGIPFGQPLLRIWSSPFGPLGTPLLDRDDPLGVIEDFFGMLARPHLQMPKVVVLPDIRLDGPFAALLQTLAESRRLPMEIINRVERPFLQSDQDGDDYLRDSLRAHHFREFRRLKRRLEKQGKLEYRVARQQDEVRAGIETFLALEASGWKGRERSAMASDRYRAAFAREAAFRLAERDFCRIHSLHLDGRAIASLVVFVESGVAYTWKTAYDETLSACSPGTLLMIEVTRNHLEDPNIEATDSCAVPDHPVMSRLWQERRQVGTVVIGIETGTDRMIRQAARQLELGKKTRNMARILRNRVRKAFKRD